MITHTRSNSRRFTFINNDINVRGDNNFRAGFTSTYMPIVVDIYYIIFYYFYYNKTERYRHHRRRRRVKRKRG